MNVAKNEDGTKPEEVVRESYKGCEAANFRVQHHSVAGKVTNCDVVVKLLPAASASHMDIFSCYSSLLEPAPC